MTKISTMPNSMGAIIIAVIVISNLLNVVYAGNTPNCISKIHLFAETGPKSSDESDGEFGLKFMYSSTCSRSIIAFPNLYDVKLYDKAGKERTKGEGDVWTFDGPSDCLTPGSVRGDTFMIDYTNCDRTNNWNVTNVIMYAELDNKDLVLLANQFAFDDPISDKRALYFHLLSSAERYPCDYDIENECIKHVYIMADTDGDHSKAGSDKGHSFTINDESFELYNRKPGNDMKKNKADLWKYEASKVGVEQDDCLKFNEVTYVGFKASSTDGWKIKTAIVTVELESGKYALLAGDVNLNKWVDKDEKHPGRAEVALTLRNDCSSM